MWRRLWTGACLFTFILKFFVIPWCYFLNLCFVLELQFAVFFVLLNYWKMCFSFFCCFIITFCFIFFFLGVEIWLFSWQSKPVSVGLLTYSLFFCFVVLVYASSKFETNIFWGFVAGFVNLWLVHWNHLNSCFPFIWIMT